ncbi:MAG: RHS repeat-associated core domain-containing protein [Acidobacteria bacterium]|nr:RHS repeat-associated core domain-containing protein [Acidobacteriota bacterium]
MVRNAKICTSTLGGFATNSTAAPPENPTTRYTATDMLGSPRVITDSEGNVIARRDFKPFGEEINSNTGERTITAKYGAADNLRQKFTTYQRDEETGLDFAEARMYENRHGRFTAVDPLLASGKAKNPRTFNRFVYCGSNPVTCSDPLGLDWILEERVEKQRVKIGKKYKTVERKFLVPVYVDKSDVVGIPRIEPGVYQDSSSGGYWALHPTSNVQSPIYNSMAEAKAAFDRWVNGPSIGPTNQGESSNVRPGFLLFEFLTGTGEEQRFFGPNSSITNGMKTSPQLSSDRNRFSENACNRSGFQYDRTRSEGQFGVTGSGTIDRFLPGIQGNGSDSHLGATVDLSESRNFVGSFRIRIAELDPSTRLTTFTVSNETGAYSTFYHLLSDRNVNTSPLGNFGGYRSNSRASLSTIRQTIMWSERNPCGFR